MSALRGLARVPPPRPRSLPRWAAPVGDARWPQRRRLAVRPAATPPATDVLVVGGGAAGLTAAIFAAAAGRSVTLLERTPACGRKILVSGGGRCNVLPSRGWDAADFAAPGDRPAALAAALRAWSPSECRHWLEADVGLDLVEEAGTAKLFPRSNRAADVRDALVAAAERAGAVVVPHARVVGLAPAPGGWAVAVEGDAGARAARAVVLATGGLSAPRLGTTGDGLDIAAALGHTLATPHPALTPLLAPHPGGARLAGLSLTDAVVTARPGAGGKPRPASPRGALLFTHRGFSGPAALDASHLVSAAIAAGAPPDAWPSLSVNWTGAPPAAWEAALAAARKGGGARLATVLARGGVPARLAAALVADVGAAPDARAADATRAQTDALVAAATAWRVPVTGTAGYAPAEVTGGGVPLAQLRLPTFESLRAPRVFVCGELAGPHGRLGGFNFAWAWTSGRGAGLGAAAAAAREG